jgi:hypothetical protein
MKKTFSDQSYYSSGSDTDSNSDSETPTENEEDIIKNIINSMPIIIVNGDKRNFDQVDSCSQYDDNRSKKPKLTKKNEALLKEIRDLTFKNNKSVVERILDSSLPFESKKSLIHESEEKESSSSERAKFSGYLEKVLKIPFGVYKDIIPASEDTSKFLLNVREKLDKAIAGHSETKSEIIDYIASIIRNPNAKTNILALQSPPGCGKCLAYNTPVLMSDGHIRRVQDISVGDYLMGDDSTPRLVKSLGSGFDTMYRITHSTSRRTYTVNSEHILCLVDNNGEIVEIQVKDYVEKGYNYQGYSNPLQFERYENYYDCAYGLGKFFGKGIIDKIPNYIRKNSFKIRLRWLEGLIYACGLYVDDTTVEFMVKKDTRMTELFFLIDSLGLHRTDDTCSEYTRVVFKIPNKNIFKNPGSFVPVRCEEQIQVEKLGEDRYYGFEIDGNNRFVLGNCIVTHNTKFVRALGEALNLPFFQISFGGMNDVSILNGHDYTYIGSKPGKIYDILVKAKSMNSLVYLDEVDKIGSIDSSKGIEINGVLTHLLDKEQNHEFYDHYLGSKIPLDLSKILFIASFNNEYNMDPVVLNRMKVIKIKESSLKEKIQIVKNFTLPEIIKNLKLQEYDIYLSEKVIKYIIINKTVHEPGMRNINKNINTLIGKINTQLFLEKASKEELQKITKDLVYENVFLTRDGVNKIIVTNELVDMFVPMRMSAAVLSMYN